MTGGARGLGNAVAVAFAKEGARAVALVDINDEETMETGKKAVEKYGAEVRLPNYCLSTTTKNDSSGATRNS